MENNIILENIPINDLGNLCEELLPEKIANFKPIPFRKIGLAK